MNSLATTRRYVVLFATLTLLGCAMFEVAKPNPETGMLPSTARSPVLLARPLAVDEWQSLVLVTGGFARDQTVALNYFDEVIDSEQLESRIVAMGLQDRVPSVQDRIGINNAYRHYKKFLWLHLEIRRQGRKQYARLTLTNPDTLEDCFVTEKYLDFIWRGVSDRNTWYPLFNSLIEYLKANSKTYKPGA